MEFKAYYLARHGKDPVHITDTRDMDALIDDLALQDADHWVANVYTAGPEATRPPIQFSIGIDPKREVGGIAHWGPEGKYFTLGNVSERDRVVYFFCSNEYEFPADSELPLEQIRAAARAFVTSGGERPTNVEWRPEF